jgi:hypothetical protein
VTKTFPQSNPTTKLMDTEEDHFSLSPFELSVQFWLDRIRTLHVTHDTPTCCECAWSHALTDKKHDCRLPTTNLNGSIM